ncbi:LrgB family protein [Clostridium ganghwense]|uniref:LrgB family protein n=1 Tax=Clostridium ganghwense TaxID=312089 RepID=A0ABT4CMI0_9CLOT|nr:LrgB family protein [Clostridium ganghwense]MCY6370262.1 LrgB family protein [Clostridium ganghwense]
MTDFISTPIFGILISLIAFEIGCFIYHKTKLTIFNPLFISIILIISFLLKFNISVDSYNEGAQFISFFLGPATVILAVPLYKKIQLLKENSLPILVGIASGSCIGITSIVSLSYLLNLDKALNISLVPKSVTVPIGIEISKQLGGIPAVTAAAIILTGIIGAVIGPLICKCFRIKDNVAVGIAIGTASHAVGTTKALELGETEGAMSGLSIGIAGLITVFAAPFILKILNIFLK